MIIIQSFSCINLLTQLIISLDCARIMINPVVSEKISDLIPTPMVLIRINLSCQGYRLNT